MTDTPKPKKRKPKKISPTALTLKECRKLGLIAGVVEQKIRGRGIVFSRDLFGVIDIVAIALPAKDGERGRTIGIQATRGEAGDHARRRAKILAEWKASAWLAAGNELEIWSWRLGGERGARKLWTLRREAITMEMFANRNPDEKSVEVDMASEMFDSEAA